MEGGGITSAETIAIVGLRSSRCSLWRQSRSPSMTNPLEVPHFPAVRACNITCRALGMTMSIVSTEEALPPLEPRSSK